jgi:hypothetical protein
MLFFRDMIVWRKINGLWYQQYNYNVADAPPPAALRAAKKVPSPKVA